VRIELKDPSDPTAASDPFVAPSELTPKKAPKPISYDFRVINSG